MSHRARRSRAEAPDEAVELAAGEVRAAFAAWAARFVELLVRDFVRPSFRADAVAWRLDATIRGLFNEAGRARPRRERLEQAFKMLDKQSADELRTTGVPVDQVVPQAEARKAEWLRSNTDLIRAEEGLRRRVERVLQDPLNQGRSVSDIAKLLEEQAGYSTSRAVLTARDQTLKLYGQIQQERQQNAGIERYVWTTSLDERVRPDHADLDGSIQRWADPPVVDQRTGRRGHPGFDYQCRCTAVAVLDEPVEGEQPEPQARQAELRQRAVAEGRFAARPPRERAVTPAPGELEAARSRDGAERRALAERERLEREADARIAAARAEAQRQAAEQQARIAATPTSPIEFAPVRGSDGTLIDITQLDHRNLGADKFRPGVLEALRSDPGFVASGRATLGAERNARTGIDYLLLQQRSPDGKGPLRGTGWYLNDGSHRLQVARELGLPTLPARVQNAAGEEIFRGNLPIGSPGPSYRQSQFTAVDVDRLPAPSDVQERENVSRATRQFAQLQEHQQAALADYLSFEHDLFQAIQNGLPDSQISSRLGLTEQEISVARGRLPTLRGALDDIAVSRPTQRGPLYRGLALTETDFDDLVERGIVDFKSATNSTSFNPSIAVDFATEAPGIYGTPERPLTRRVVFRIAEVDRGAMVMHEGNVLAHQQEVLVGKSKFEIAGRTFDQARDVWVFDLRQVGSSSFR